MKHTLSRLLAAVTVRFWFPCSAWELAVRSHAERGNEGLRSKLLAAVAVVGLFGGGDWPQFHGPDNSSVSAEKGLPKTFSDTENLAWKAPLPGRGPSSPIVVGGRVVVTCSSGLRQDRLHVLCFNAADGKLLWHRQLWATGHTICNPFAAIAIPTPASDGRLIFAFYASNDLACFDLDGNLQWFRGLAYESPTARNDDAMASSPRIFGDTVVVQIENLGDSFAAGINIHTGETRWRQDLEHDTAWTSPFALRGKTPSDDILLLQRRTRLTAHDPQTGRQLWAREGANHFHSTGTTSGDRIYLPCDGLVALQVDPLSKEPQPLWQEKRLAVGYSSPVVFDGRVYAVKTAGVLVCATRPMATSCGSCASRGRSTPRPCWLMGISTWSATTEWCK